MKLSMIQWVFVGSHIDAGEVSLRMNIEFGKGVHGSKRIKLGTVD